ncbi:cobalt-precorrin-6A reductase [Bosea sp. 117]|uniref:cobalt-precorrin-6A reductase n=1 Tax=Bosea sp. 117 TaxID=1125973 RepID=UPI000493E03D|nr:cobalt-precorrin-6A reductase [Bosea sp. 117]
MIRPSASAQRRILLLGGTTEARLIAERLAGRGDIDLTVSLAGRTQNPLAVPGAVRSGGFGGAKGLAAYLAAERFDALVDATHPFAAGISANAAEAARLAGLPFLALRRPAWQPQRGDRWREAADIPAALALIGAAPRRVFVTLGRNEVGAIEAAPQHAFLIRSIDPIVPRLKLSDARYIEARGPFEEAAERALLTEHRIEVILAKNSGGAASYGKLAAARVLGIEAVLIARPKLPDVPTVDRVDAVLEWMEHLGSGHQAAPPARRGV